MIHLLWILQVFHPCTSLNSRRKIWRIVILSLINMPMNVNSWAAYISCKTIYTPGFNLLFCGLTLANFPRGHRCMYSGKRRHCSRAGTMDIWATSSTCLPWRSAQALSDIYHFHLIIKYCYTCPTVWVGGSYNTNWFYDERLRWHGNLVAHDYAISL